MSYSAARNIRFSSLFKIGDLVVLNDSTEQAYITAFDDEETDEDNDIKTCTIRYDIDNRFEYNVDLKQLKVIHVLSGGGTRSGGLKEDTSLPPTLPKNHERYNETNNETNTVSVEASQQEMTQVQLDHHIMETNKHLFSTMKDAFTDSYQFFTKKNSSENTLSQLPLYQFLWNGKDRGKGWIRNVISPKAVQKGLDTTQGLIYLLMICFFRTIDGRSKQGCFSHGSLLHNAFGVGREHSKTFFNRIVRNNFTFQKKQRSDVGMSVFNCEKKRDKCSLLSILSILSRKDDIQNSVIIQENWIIIN